jgi:hypothetical protein
MSRPCPATGCGELVADDAFACSEHWPKLPADVRRALVDAWDAYAADRTNPLTHRMYETVRATATRILAPRE